METKTIDLTPTWLEATECLVAVLENGTEKGKTIAREELYRMATLADSVKQYREEVSRLSTALDNIVNLEQSADMFEQAFNIALYAREKKG